MRWFPRGVSGRIFDWCLSQPGFDPSFRNLACLATLKSSDRTKQVCLWMSRLYIYKTNIHVYIISFIIYIYMMSRKVDKPKHWQQIQKWYFVFIVKRLHQNDEFFFGTGGNVWLKIKKLVWVHWKERQKRKKVRDRDIYQSGGSRGYWMWPWFIFGTSGP